MADADEVQALVDFAVARFGGLHVMFNNAGISSSFRRLLENDLSDFDRVMAVNLLGVMVGSRCAARHMAEQRRRLDHQHHLDGRAHRGAVADRLPDLEGGGHPVHPVGRRRTWPSTGSG